MRGGGSPAPPFRGAWPVPFLRDVDSGGNLEAWARKYRCVTSISRLSVQDWSLAVIICLPRRLRQTSESLERLHRAAPPHLGTLGLAGVTARYGSPEGPAHPEGPRPAPPRLPKTRRFPTPRRRQAAPPRLRPAGGGRGGRQRCQRGNRGGPREAEVAPRPRSLHRAPPAASAMDASLEKVRTRAGGRRCGPGASRPRGDCFPVASCHCDRGGARGLTGPA